MAIVLNMEERRSKKLMNGNNSGKNTGKNKGIEGWFEKPLFEAEMRRVIVSRVDHPNHSNEIVIDLLYIWAALYISISSYWIVKYII